MTLDEAEQTMLPCPFCGGERLTVKEWCSRLGTYTSVIKFRIDKGHTFQQIHDYYINKKIRCK